MSSILNFHPASKSSAHLSAGEIDDQLIGDLAAAPSAHLASCSLCAERFAEAASRITSFRDVTAAWSERRSATLPIPQLAKPLPLWQRRTAWIATSAALALGLTLTSSSHRGELKTSSLRQLQAQPSHPVAVPTPSATERASARTASPAAQISADNQMLKAVDNELDTSLDSPTALGLDTANDHPKWTPATLSVQD